MLISINALIIEVLTTGLPKLNPSPNDNLSPFFFPRETPILPSTLRRIVITITTLIRRELRLHTDSITHNLYKSIAERKLEKLRRQANVQSILTSDYIFDSY